MATRKPTAPAHPALDSDAVVDAALVMIAEDGLAGFTLQGVAGRLAVPVAQVVGLFADRFAVMDAAFRRLDGQMLDGITREDEAEPVRDRLFDIVMRRIDALKPHKATLERVMHDGWKDPAMMVGLTVLMRRSLGVMLEAGGVSVRGLGGQLRLKGMGAVVLMTMRAWLSDDSPDMAKTMKALDKALDRASDAEHLLCRCRTQQQAGEAPAEPEIT